MAFYDRFVELCQIKGEKPTPLLNKLNIGAGNVRRWKNGSSVIFDTLNILANYFGVPISYFFDEDDEPSVEWVKSGNSLKEVYNSLKAHPDYIASVLNGFDKNLPKYSDYERISEAFNISFDYMLTGDKDRQ